MEKYQPGALMQIISYGAEHDKKYEEIMLINKYKSYLNIYNKYKNYKKRNNIPEFKYAINFLFYS